MKYRKKPLIIEAIQYNGDIHTLLGFGVPVIQNFLEDAPEIETLEGDMTISHGDYIIKGIKGEFYPIKEDIFLASYEAVDE